MDVCGFMVVRKPTENYQPVGKGIWPRQPPQVGKLYYGGVWRMPWCDINFDLYDGQLPEELRDLYSSNVRDIQGSGFALCSGHQIANTLLCYCNRDKPKCEVIAVYSPTLASMKGTISVPDSLLVHQGYDPFQIGGDSLLIDGIFSQSELFPGWFEKLNHGGLLTSAEEASQYISTYLRLVDSGKLEEIFPTDASPIEAITVLALNNQ